MAKPRKTKAKKPTKAAKKAPKSTSAFLGLWRALGWTVRKSLKWGTVCAIWGLIAFTLAAAWYGSELPDVDQAFNATRKPTVTVLAADGTVLARSGDDYGRLARLDQLPPSLPAAVLATEDRRFYSHFGIDLIGLARAMAANVKARRIVQGGSTITQQVAKNLFLTPERTIKRKFQELLLALWLEQKFSKAQILSIYLNRVYLGSGTYGVDAAARKYFGRGAEKVTTYQAAMLAGLLKAPSRYNPIASPARAGARTRQVLKNMVAAGALSRAGARRAEAETGQARAEKRLKGGRYFVDWVLEQVSGYVNAGDRDLVVQTTLDTGLQRLTEREIEKTLKSKGKKSAIGQAALVTMTPMGAVRAMVGGRLYGASQFNRATQAGRQPGSAFKPVVYLAGLEAGLNPDTMLVDEPVSIGNWRPANFNRKYSGPVSLRDALARSINTVAVKVAERAGRGAVINTARRLGLTGNFKATPSLALGVGEVNLTELTAAYATFANGGAGTWAFGIEEIRDAGGNILYRRDGSGPGRVVAANHVVAINDMLSTAVTSGTGRKAAIGRPQAGKTGTSQNFRDAWFVGYTADLVTGVWMGNDNARPMKKVTGGGAPAELWRDVMAVAHKGLSPRPLPGLESAAPVPENNSPGFWKSLVGVLTGGDG
ncbi:MAG: PBP1A family penicillin-binding protein [Alphaproteobacteria bacterium]|nr:PBP1A family penicillin-binding protein [Alphaproteobacteria bacterium]MBT7944303.1 PBP1A family penicillin-binding protein [Alphaproteobacteria bacterium]